MNTIIQTPPTAAYADRLGLALFFAIAIHALIILGISFEAFNNNTPSQNMPTLDISVVQQDHSQPEPEEADYLAEISQDGSGNTDEQVRPQQELSAQTPPPSGSPDKPEPVQVLTRENSERLSQAVFEPTPEQTPEPATASELVNRSMEMLSLNEQINQSILAYSQAPKSTYISARTKAFKYANYMRDWVAKVERIGDLNYPDVARRSSLSGSLIVEVGLYPDGNVRNVTILRPSGHKLLDDAAVSIVKLAAPYPPFPENIRKETDVLYITRTWVFTSSNHLQSR